MSRNTPESTTKKTTNIIYVYIIEYIYICLIFSLKKLIQEIEYLLSSRKENQKMEGGNYYRDGREHSSRTGGPRFLIWRSQQVCRTISEERFILGHTIESFSVCLLVCLCLFLLWHAATWCGISVPRLGNELRPQQWKHWILTTWPPMNLLLRDFFFFFNRHAEISRPGSKPKPQQRQCQILNH